jgi:hypothetical protein
MKMLTAYSKSGAEFTVTRIGGEDNLNSTATINIKGVEYPCFLTHVKGRPAVELSFDAARALGAANPFGAKMMLREEWLKKAKAEGQQETRRASLSQNSFNKEYGIYD